jgi:Tfp pilus assembly protein PilF
MSPDVSGTAAAESAYQSGMELLSRGNLRAASQAFRSAIEMAPSLAQAHLGLGHSLRRQRQTREAESALRHARELEPALQEACFSLAFLLHGEGRDLEAAGVLTELAANQADDLTLQRQVAGLLMDFGLFTTAEPLARRITEAAPAAGAWQRVGLCLLQQGHMPEAEDTFLRAVQHDPLAGSSYLLMSQTHRATEADLGRLSKYQTLLEDHKLTGEARACLHFALGNWFEDLGDYAAAWGQFSAGNALRSMERPFDQAVWEPYFRRLLLSAPAATLKRETMRAQPQPLFLVGLPGANPEPLASLLASHSAVCSLGASGQMDSVARACEQLVDTSYPECLAKLEATQLAGLEPGIRSDWPDKSQNATWVLDESALNFLHIALIMLVFPNSRIIYQHRQPLDECLSAYLCNHPQPIHNHAHDLRFLGFFYRQFSALMGHWRESLSPTSLLNLRVDTTHVGSTANTAAVWRFLDLDAPSAANSPHAALRSVLAADPMRRDVPGRWRNYRKHLGPLLEAAGLDSD